MFNAMIPCVCVHVHVHIHINKIKYAYVHHPFWSLPGTISTNTYSYIGVISLSIAVYWCSSLRGDLASKAKSKYYHNDRIPGIKNSLIGGLIYRYPKSRIGLFNVLLEKTLSPINKNDKLCLICRNLNINPLQLNHHPTQQFISTVLGKTKLYCTYLNITLPTRLSDHWATLIDQIRTTCLTLFILGRRQTFSKPDSPRIYGDKNIKKFQKKHKQISKDNLDAGYVNEAYDLFWEMVWHAYCESFSL